MIKWVKQECSTLALKLVWSDSSPMFNKNENLIGLDVGSHTVKLIQVSVRDMEIKLIKVGMIPLPNEALFEGRIGNPEAVAHSIVQLTNHLKIKDRFVASSVSGYEVMVKQKIVLPSMTEEELQTRMHSELGQYVPYDIAEVEVDYQVLDVVKDRPNFMEVLLVAAKKDFINDHVKLLKLSKLRPAVVDVDFFALSNAFEAVNGFSDEQNITLIDIGAHKALISIVNQGSPVFSRCISIGGSQITESIHSHFRISFEKAERLKLGEAVEGIESKDLEGIFIAVVGNWVGECRRALTFYYSNYPESKVKKVYLSGGSCRIPGLERVFEEVLDAPVEIFNPLSRIKCNSEAFDASYLDYIGPQMAISLGLALRRAIER
jgi:type IV pilus assembly protein PilM